MNLDGEYRTAFIKADHPSLSYGTAPGPVDPSQPSLYGGGYVVGNVLGIPKGAAHTAAAWVLAKYLTLDKRAIEKFAVGLGNVPTITTILSDPVFTKDPHFATFLKIFSNPNTVTSPNTAIGTANQDTLGNFIDKWEAGSVSDLVAGLKAVDAQINAQVQNATAGQAP